MYQYFNQHKIKIAFLLRFGTLCFSLFLSSFTTFGQEVMMAKANKNICITIGAANIYRLMIRNTVGDMYDDENEYSIKCSNPIQASFEYAITDYTTIGVSANYYSFHLSETKTNPWPYFVDTRGTKIALHLRGVRYFIQRPKSAFYFFGGLGMRFRSMTTTGTDQTRISQSDLFQINEISLSKYTPLSIEFGLGVKLLVSKRIGICAEYGAITSIGRFGLCYVMRNKWRRTKDNIGW